MSEETNESTYLDERYLIYFWHGERFGVRISDVQEVVKYQTAKPIPYTTREFEGVVNLRGRIVSVIDLAKKFESTNSNKERSLMLILATGDDNHVAVLIDEIDQVYAVSSDQIEINPTIDTKIPKQFLSGIAKIEQQLIHLIDLPKLVCAYTYTHAA
jgi:purine-binding chemotaxis protein CheW